VVEAERYPMLDGSWWDAIKDAITVLLGMAVVYLIALVSKPSLKQVIDLIKPVDKSVGDLGDRLARLETKTDGHVTRAEFKEAITELKSAWQHGNDGVMAAISDVRTDMRDLRRESS